MSGVTVTPFSGNVNTGIYSLTSLLNAYGTDVNSSGTVVGFQQSGPTNGNRRQGFVGKLDGTFNLLPIDPAYMNRLAQGVNDAGTIVGYSYNSNSAYQPFIFKDGKYEYFLKGQGFASSIAVYVNDDMVAGNVFNASQEFAFLYSDNVFKKIGTFGGQYNSFIGNINTLNDAVGISVNAGGLNLPFIHIGTDRNINGIDFKAGSEFLLPEFNLGGLQLNKLTGIDVSMP